jgi:hypothetical protein
VSNLRVNGDRVLLGSLTVGEIYPPPPGRTGYWYRSTIGRFQGNSRTREQALRILLDHLDNLLADRPKGRAHRPEPRVPTRAQQRTNDGPGPVFGVWGTPKHPSIPAPRRSHTEPRRASGAQKSHAEWTTCPHCRVELKHLRKHIRRKHPDLAITKATAVPNGKRRGSKSGEGRQPGSSKTGTRKRKTKRYEKCRVCGVPRLTGLMHVHMMIAHGPGRKTFAKRSRRIPQRRAKHPDAIERSHDATRDTGHVRREQGRFGSHPAHDDFSDEARP